MFDANQQALPGVASARGEPPAKRGFVKVILDGTKQK